MLRPFFLVLLLSSCLPSFARTSDWSESVSVDQLKHLIRQKVGEVVPINHVWTHPLPSGETTEQTIFFAGGRFRRLLNWIDVSLSSHSFQEVLRMPPPSISDLNPLSVSTDRDFFVRSNDARHWLHTHGFANWDILDEKFYQASVAAGGSTLEKVRVNPRFIEDPYQAIEAFHRGELEFLDAPAEVFDQYRTGVNGLTDVTKTALVLRAIRQTYDVPRLRISDRTWGLFRQICHLERDVLRSDNYMVKKHLRKLFIATGENAIETLNILRRLGLHTTLAKLNYQFEGKDGRSPISLSALLFSKGVAHRIGTAKNRREFILRAKQLLNIPGTEIIVDQWLSDNADLFFSIEPQAPTFDDVVALLEAVPLRTYQDSILIDFIPTISSAEQMLSLFEKALEVGHSRHADKMVNRNIAYIFGANSEEFIRLGPTPQQVDRFVSKLTFINSILEWHKARFNLAETPDEFIAAMAPAIQEPSQQYIDNLKKEAVKNLNAFFRLHPTVQQVNVLKQKFTSVSQTIAVMEHALAFIPTPEDITAILDPLLDRPSEDYMDAIDWLYRKHFARIQEIHNPALSDPCASALLHLSSGK